MTRRAYVMPLVIMLVLVLGLLISVVLERQSTQTLSARRQIGQYESHHAGRGIQDAFDAWFSSGQSKPFRERMAPDGHLVDFTLPEGLGPSVPGPLTVRVFGEDAQATMLADFTGLTGQTLADARALLDALKQITGEDWQRHTRSQGPVTISATSAPEDLLQAVVRAATDSSIDGGEFVNSINRARAETEPGKGISPQAFNQAVMDGGFEPTQAAMVHRLVTPDTSFWKLRIEVVRENRTIDAYDAYLQIPPRGGRNAVAGATRRSSIVSITRRKVE